MIIKIVVPCIDGAFEHEIPDRRAQRRAPPLRHDCVVLRSDQGSRDIRAADELDGGHSIAEKRPHRSPPVEITGHGLERVERRDQDQSRDRPMSREIGGDRSADADADRKDEFVRPVEPVASLIGLNRAFPLAPGLNWAAWYRSR
jgi:hypothetical protein